MTYPAGEHNFLLAILELSARDHEGGVARKSTKILPSLTGALAGFDR